MINVIVQVEQPSTNFQLFQFAVRSLQPKRSSTTSRTSLEVIILPTEYNQFEKFAIWHRCLAKISERSSTDICSDRERLIISARRTIWLFDSNICLFVNSILRKCGSVAYRCLWHMEFWTCIPRFFGYFNLIWLETDNNNFCVKIWYENISKFISSHLTISLLWHIFQ